MNFYEEAQEKLRRELPGITGNREGAIKTAVREFSAMLETLDRIQDGETKGKLRAACAAVLDGFMGRVKK